MYVRSTTEQITRVVLTIQQSFLKISVLQSNFQVLLTCTSVYVLCTYANAAQCTLVYVIQGTQYIMASSVPRELAPVTRPVCTEGETNKGVCAFCQCSDVDSEIVGETLQKGDLVVHQFCLVSFQ